jgi:pimeloyl-ACP methyl ester carboxylesterase
MTLAHEEEILSWHEPDPVPLRATLIVLPGRGESAQVYERFGRRLSADAYRVHVVPAPSDDAERAGDRLSGLLADADPDVPRVVVGSDGGAAYAAHRAASAGPAGVGALLLAGRPAAPAAAADRDWDGELEARTSCPTHRGRITRAGVRRGALFTDLPAEWFDPAGAGRITVPVLGIHGRADTVSPFAEARAWYAAVPRAELVGIDGGPHDALNDQTHRTVAATIVLFLERLRRGGDLAPIATAEPLRAE